MIKRIIILLAIMLTIIFTIMILNKKQDANSGPKTLKIEENVEKQKANSAKITLKVKEEKEVFNKLRIKYLSFGHEHSSSGPDEPFSATVGVYFFELSEDNSTESITIYLDVNAESESVEWKNYTITLMNSDDQKEITMIVEKQEK